MTTPHKKHVAVLMGGWSAEREVSLVSGAGVAKALEEEGYRVTAVDVQRDLEGLLRALTDPRPDAVFNALHGRGGEDGTIQGVLEFLGIPYTHSGVRAAAVAMDKAMTKALLAPVGVRSPKGLVLTKGELTGGAHPMPAPYIVKPVDEGSTVGVTLVREGQNSPVGDAWTFGERALVEEFIPGRELTVGVMGGLDGECRPLTVTEIHFEAQVYDYTAKYSAGHAVHTVPAQIPEQVAEEAKRLAVLAHRTLGCRGVSRSDFRWDDRKSGTDGLFFLEINNQPGMTPLSLVPEQAAAVGLSYGALVAWMVENAACQLD
ncbi:D-alanine--D-alanine ligase [Azospirillum baldaniorum]|uniref:D-alanine--D-alanine ligase n=1 Tax=Azospirillum baldaniorum TaxID=1064539 RepID=A0A9P1NMV2_9PROT|nr:D-alanine--D-alanine ligase [Azospirillum baldaniorum]AWJ89155.1 D-alanine--D-alanine ligase [Azospirillum baldaniorum]TWA80733.1 D-alanine-D-alanine ligase [Azospirillum brasilense]CCC99035.1 D-alanine-D-alanine ligase [Azospirillum baldaniorum]